MKRLTALAVCCLLALAGCGGASHHATARHAVSAAASQSAMGSVHPPGWGSAPSGLMAPAPSAAPSYVMWDSIDVATVPAQPFAVAGYTAGWWPTYLPLVSTFPRAHHVSIAIAARWHADCLDVEPGDAIPAQAGAWAVADIAAGFKRPCLYSDLAEMPAVRASLTAAGLKRSQYLLWLAWYRFVPGLVNGYDAVQFSDRALGRNLDESSASAAFLGIVLPKPKPARLVCFPKPNNAAACQKLRSRVASLERAAAASQRAHDATARRIASLTALAAMFQAREQRYSAQAAQLVKAAS